MHDTQAESTISACTADGEGAQEQALTQLGIDAGAAVTYGDGDAIRSGRQDDFNLAIHRRMAQ
ncbi:hypothetical protein Q6326_29235, partial [Klebsiella pneumoniae]